MHIFIWHQGWFYFLYIISVVKFEVDWISDLLIFFFFSKKSSRKK